MATAPKGKPRELPSEGIHQAVLISIIDVGTQEPNNPTFNASRRVYFNFELVGPGLTTEEGNPFFMRRDYTFSEKSKNLLRDLKAWKGIKSLADYDFDQLLGQSCALTVAHSEDGQYANITNISALMKGTKVFKPKNALSSFYINEDDGIDDTEFKALPEWLRLKIAASPEYAAAMAPKLKKGAKVSPTKKVATKGKGK